LICGQIIGGRGRDRTGDPLLAKQVLSQLSYTPTARLVLMVKHLQLFANSENSLLTLYCVKTPVVRPVLEELKAEEGLSRMIGKQKS
jgi:hypothetical protein